MSDSPKNKEVKVDSTIENQAEEKTEEQTSGEKRKTQTIKDVEGAFLSGVEKVIGKAQNLDTKITNNAQSLYSSLTGHLRDSIDSYNKSKE